MTGQRPSTTARHCAQGLESDQSFDYLHRLLGHTAIPVDRHLLRILPAAQVTDVRYEDASRILYHGVALAGVAPRHSEWALWSYSAAHAAALKHDGAGSKA